MKVQLEPLRGFRDILPPESERLKQLIAVFARLARQRGYREVIPPTLERFELFALKSGEEIRNSMFTFKDKGGREVALRPEATASIARIYLKHLRGRPKPIRLYYIVNCFRYENPQRARYREFWQAGVELLGGEPPYYDVEVIKLLADYIAAVGLKPKARLKIGSTRLYRTLFTRYGIPEEVQDHILHLMDKKMYDKALEAVKASKGGSELASIVSRLWETPHNIDQAVPLLNDIPEAKQALEELLYIKQVFEAYELPIPYYFDLSFARGLAYYTGIIFEVEVEGFDFSVAGGGRYDNLVQLYGGEYVPSTGFAIGLDRVLYVLEELGVKLPAWEPKVRVAIAVLSAEALAYALRVQDAIASSDSVEAQMLVEPKLSKLIPRLLEQGYTHLIVVGAKEASQRTVTVKDLRTRVQREVQLDKLNELLRAETS